MPVETAIAPSICVVICCYTTERWPLLTAAIDAAEQQLDATDTLVVVVDHHRALHARLVERYGARSRVRVVDSDGAPGLSTARNTGVALAAADVVVFLDDDATLQPDSLAAVRSAMADDSVVAVGGAVTPWWLDGGAPGWFPEEFGWVVGCDYRGLPPHGAEIRNPIGAAMAARREALATIGGFSARLGRRGDVPAGCEETLMGIALRRADRRNRIVRDTGFRVRHAVPASRGRPRYYTRRCYQEGRSKAVLAGLASTEEALSSERTYATRILPSGAWRARRKPLRVLALLAGFLCTATGFAIGRAGMLRAARREERS